MRSVVRIVSWALLFASLAAAAAAWFTPTPELEADDAAGVALAALGEAGIDGELAARPRPTTHHTEEGDEVPAWLVLVDVDADGSTERIELRVQRTAGQLVYVDDRIGADDAERLLSDEQFEAMGRYRDDSLSDQWVLRNVLAGVAAVVIAATCYVLATRTDRLRSAP